MFARKAREAAVISEGSTRELTYQVKGMTCSHCVAAVTEKVSAVPGTAGVEVDLDSGRLALRGAAVDDDAIRAAVEAAGYSLV
jgi:copper chaperone CopZ